MALARIGSGKRLAVGVGSYSRDDGAGRSDLPVTVPMASKPVAVLRTVPTVELSSSDHTGGTSNNSCPLPHTRLIKSSPSFVGLKADLRPPF